MHQSITTRDQVVPELARQNPGPTVCRRDGGCGPSDGSGPPQRAYGDLQGVGRAFAMLEQIAERPMRASQLARTMGIKWTTAHRTLCYLASMGYIERDTGGEYFVGVRTFSVGSSYVASLRLSEAARPYLQASAFHGQATVQLVKRDHRRSVVLSVYDTLNGHVPDTTVGCNFPLHCGSKGHVLLAYASDQFLEAYLARPLENLTPYTIADPHALRTRLAEVRQRGYAVTSRDVRVFSASVAAPIHDRSGQVVGAVTLLVPPDDLAERLNRLSQLVVGTARLVSGALARVRDSRVLKATTPR